jgi:hypothetical protein
MKTPCPYCGNNPVPHRFYWYSESLNIFLTPFRQKILYNPLSRFFKGKMWPGKIGKFFLDLGLFFGVVSLMRDVRHCKVRRAQVLWEEAQKRGIDMSELLLFGRPVDVYVAEKKYPLSIIHNPLPSKIRDKRLRIIFNGLPRPAGYVNKWLDLMDDKWLFKKAMLENGLPVPTGASCSSFSQARENFNRIQKPVIVKPRAGSRGRHSTTFVSSESDLKKAFKIAKQLCRWVIVEEQLFGPVYRATVIGGPSTSLGTSKLAGVLRGDPPFVTGDGLHSIADLISAKNSQPHPGVHPVESCDAGSRQVGTFNRVKDIAADASCEVFLSRQNLTLSSVLEKGTVVNLSEKIGVNYGGSSSEDFDICHADNKELFLRAARVLGDPVVGFDYIIPDITKSYKEQRTGFIEVNSLPFINLHHDPLLGAARNAAALVWDMLGW